MRFLNEQNTMTEYRILDFCAPPRLQRQCLLVTSHYETLLAPTPSHVTGDARRQSMNDKTSSTLSILFCKNKLLQQRDLTLYLLTTRQAEVLATLVILHYSLHEPAWL